MSIKKISYATEESWAEIEPQLEVADIILTTKYSSLFSSTIRRVTKSHWSHVALVYAVPDPMMHVNSVLIIEALDNGIEIHRVHKYTKRFDLYDVGVKRIPNLSEAMKKRVIAYMLNNVDTPYNYSQIAINLFKSFMPGFISKYEKRWVNPDDFVCSTFTQKAFIEALPHSKKDSVLFAKDSRALENIEETTPADIARSDSSIWLYNPHE